MAFIADRVLDNGLTILDTEANRFDICSQEPVTYTEAITTYSLGNKTSFAVGSPQDGVTNGRRVVAPAITDGTVTGNGTATHWAIVDTGNSRLLATGALAASQVVTSGNVFTTTAFNITIPDAA